MRGSISVTRRHVDFLFGGSCKDSPRFLTRPDDMQRNLQGEGDWVLPSADDDHTGEELE